MATDPDIEALLGAPKSRKMRPLPADRKKHGDNFVRRVDQGKLQELLIQACPGDQKSVPKLARALGLSAWGVGKWVKNNRLPAAQVEKLVQIGGGRVTREDFYPFVFRV